MGAMSVRERMRRAAEGSPRQAGRSQAVVQRRALVSAVKRDAIARVGFDEMVRIVGGDEIFGRSNYISVDSPMARALLGKSEGDEATVITPKGPRLWYVNKISYVKPDWFTEQKLVTHEIEPDDEDIAADVEAAADLDPKEIEQEYLKSMMGQR